MNKKKSYHQQREELSDEGKQLGDKMMGEEVEEADYTKKDCYQRSSC